MTFKENWDVSTFLLVLYTLLTGLFCLTKVYTFKLFIKTDVRVMWQGNNLLTFPFPQQFYSYKSLKFLFYPSTYTKGQHNPKSKQSEWNEINLTDPVQPTQSIISYRVKLNQNQSPIKTQPKNTKLAQITNEPLHK